MHALRKGMVPRRWIALVLLAVAACTPAGGSPAPTPGPTVLPGPTGGAILDPAELRLLLIDRLGPRWYCDPDVYPIEQGSEQQRAIERFPEMLAEHELFTAIAARLGLDPNGAFTDAQKLDVYRIWKVAVSIPLDVIGDGRYRFDYLAEPAAGAAEGTRTAGIITASGEITIEQQAPAGEPSCPICLAEGTRIDTPGGAVAVEALRLGDPIWTFDAAGRRVAGTVIALGSTPAPAEHRVIRLTLADGRTVTASPGHPLADGRRLGDVRIGDRVDGDRVADVASLPYREDATWDVVASGLTGGYYAGGIPLGSTLVAGPGGRRGPGRGA
jgi:hypothetical protein